MTGPLLQSGFEAGHCGSCLPGGGCFGLCGGTVGFGGLGGAGVPSPLDGGVLLAGGAWVPLVGCSGG